MGSSRLPLGIDLRAFDDGEGRREEFRREIGAGEEILVGFVGRLTEIKNIPMYFKGSSPLLHAGEYRFTENQVFDRRRRTLKRRSLSGGHRSSALAKMFPFWGTGRMPNGFMRALTLSL